MMKEEVAAFGRQPGADAAKTGVPAALQAPIPMQVDNFRPFSVTHWAGPGVVEKYKKHLLSCLPSEPVGESWEFSADPQAPTNCPTLGMDLPELLAKHGSHVLGSQAAAGCRLMLKIIATSEPLSFQLHPEDGDPGLAPGECGKPESWLILDRQEGAGVYLGFTAPVPLDEFAGRLRGGGDLRPYLQFVPVQPGDFFEIPPGVPHAIGPGVMLLEPQRIIPGASGKTYRMWDWGRRYSADGKTDPRGQPRALHVEESLRLLRPERDWGLGLVERLVDRPRWREVGPGRSLASFPGNGHYQVRLLRVEAGGLGPLALEAVGSYGVVFIARGAVCGSQDSIAGANAARYYLSGQTILLPSSAMPCRFLCEEPAELILITQGGTRVWVDGKEVC